MSKQSANNIILVIEETSFRDVQDKSKGIVVIPILNA